MSFKGKGPLHGIPQNARTMQKQEINCQLAAQALQPLGDRGSFQDNFAQTEGTDSKFSE